MCVYWEHVIFFHVTHLLTDERECFSCFDKGRALKFYILLINTSGFVLTERKKKLITHDYLVSSFSSRP
jgi:hypothetical protein